MVCGPYPAHNLFVQIVFMAHCHVRLFMNHLWLLSHHTIGQRWAVPIETEGKTYNVHYLALYRKKFADLKDSDQMALDLNTLCETLSYVVPHFRIRHWVFSNIRISSLENTSLIYYLKLFPRWQRSSFFPLGSATARCNLWNSLHTHHGNTLPPFGDIGLFKSIYLLFILPYKCFLKVALYFSLNVF